MFIYTDADAKKAVDWLKNQKEVSYDVETNSLNHRDCDAKIIGFGFSNAVQGFYLPIYSFDPAKSVLVQIEGAAERSTKILNALKTKKINTFNGAFDLPFTKAALGVDLLDSLWCDVLLLKHTVDEDFPFKLKEIAIQVFGYGAASEQRDLYAELKERGAAKHELYKATMPTIGKYCIQDCMLTARLKNHYLPLLKAEGLESFFFEQEVMPLYKAVTIPMEQRGIKLDLALMQQSLVEITADIQALEDSIQKQIKPLLTQGFNEWFLGKDYEFKLTGNFGQGIAKYFGLHEMLPLTAAGKVSLASKALKALESSRGQQILLKQVEITPEEVAGVRQFMCDLEYGASHSLFNLQSKHHLKHLFFNTLKLEPISTTELGNPQVDDEFISSIAPQFAWASELQTYNRLNKIKSTYIERFLEKQVDGVFYPSFYQHRTVSGRLAGDIQQLPRAVDDSKTPEVVRKYVNQIRTFFISRPENVFVDADYNSAEPRVFASVSGDPRLQNIFNSGLDFYSEIAIRTEKLTEYSSLKTADNYLGKINPAKRQSAKAYSLGVVYGESGYKLQFQLGCTQQEGDKLVDDYLNAFPDLKAWMESSKKFVLEHGYMKCIGGRIRHMPKAKELHARFGLSLLDSLHLYKEFSAEPALYEQMKTNRKTLKNLINNANNVQIQAAVASMINRASIAIMGEFKIKNLQACIVAQIHDQLIVECLEKDKHTVAKIVQDKMENSMKFAVSIPADPNFGKNFKESKGA